MTPFEINIKIAEMRYGKKITISQQHTYNPVYILAYDNAAERMRYYNWAENIADAWELFEEMPLVLISKYSDNDYEVQCGVIVPTERATTAPIAICLAWIKWKESKNSEFDEISEHDKHGVDTNVDKWMD